MKPTIKQVADKAGYSIATVSRILNGDVKSFPKSTRDLVESCAEELGYTPNLFGKNLRSSTQKRIGVILPDLNNPFFIEFLVKLETLLSEDESLILYSTRRSNVVNAVTYLLDQGADKFIIASKSDTLADNEQIIRKLHNRTVMFFDRSAQIQKDKLLSVNHFYGGSLAAEYLLKYQHKKFTVVSPNNDLDTFNDRIVGFMSKINEQRYPVEIIPCELNRQSAYDVVPQIMKNLPTAIFTTSDELAIGLISGLQHHNIRIPEDVSIMGYDGTELGRYLNPSLTSVDQSPKQLAIYAYAYINGQVSHTIEKPTICERQSVAVAKSIN